MAISLLKKLQKNMLPLLLILTACIASVIVYLNRERFTALGDAPGTEPLRVVLDSAANFSAEQEKALNIQISNIRREILKAIEKSNTQDAGHRARLDKAAQSISEAAKEREEIVRVIKEEIPRYAQAYIKEESKKQHDKIVGHIDNVISNINTTTSKNLNNLRDAILNHVKQEGQDLEKRVAQATYRQLSQSLNLSRNLSERVVDFHNKGYHMGNR